MLQQLYVGNCTSLDGDFYLGIDEIYIIFASVSTVCNIREIDFFNSGFSDCTLLPLLLETYASVFAIEW